MSDTELDLGRVPTATFVKVSGRGEIKWRALC